MQLSLSSEQKLAHILVGVPMQLTHAVFFISTHEANNKKCRVMHTHRLIKSLWVCWKHAKRGVTEVSELTTQVKEYDNTIGTGWDNDRR